MVYSYKNFSIGNGYHFIDKYVLISTGIGLIPVTVISFPISICNSIINNTFLRMNYYHINMFEYILSNIISYVILSLISIFINIIVSFYIFDSKIPDITFLFPYVIQCLYCVIVFLFVGYIIASLVVKPDIMLPLGMIILFVIYAFSGVFINYSELPRQIQNISTFLPWKYLMNDFYKIWTMKFRWDTDFIKINTIWLASSVLFETVIFAIKKLGDNKNEKTNS